MFRCAVDGKSGAATPSLSLVQRLLQPGGDVAQRGTGGEDLRHPGPLELGDVGLRDDPAGEDQHVAGALRPEFVDDPREKRHVGPGQDRQADGVGVLLDDGRGDLLRRLVQPGVDDLEPRLAQRPSDDPGPTVVTVEARFGYHHPVGTLHRLRYSQVRAPPGQPGRTVELVELVGQRCCSPGQPATNERRTRRSGLSTFVSTRTTRCHVPSAGRPLRTGSTSDGDTNTGSK